MLKNWARPEKPEGEELKQRLKAAEEKLSQQQMKLKEKRLPVLVLIEGWGAAGKGSAIGQIIKNIDPRFFKVFSMPSTPTEEERRRPFLYRFFEKIPEAGKFTFLDSGWMDQIMKERLDGKLDDKAYAQRVDSVKRFERGLTDNGYLVLKFFFHISKKEQESRIDALLSEKDTAWRVSEGDLWQNRHYDKCLEAFDRRLPEILRALGEDGMLIITADHGCDPAFPTTDHTRERVPVLAWGLGLEEGVALGERKTFADVSATVLEALGARARLDGTSFYGEIALG